MSASGVGAGTASLPVFGSSTWTVPSGVTTGESCVYAANPVHVLDLNSPLVRIAWSNVGRWRQRTDWTNMGSSCQNSHMGAACYRDPNSGLYRATFHSSAFTSVNREYVAESSIGADIYNTAIPSGMRIRNGLLGPDGTRYDVHLDVDATQIPSGADATKYYQFESYESLSAFGGSILRLNQLVPNPTNAGPGLGSGYYSTSDNTFHGGAGSSLESVTGGIGDKLTLAYELTFFEAGTTTPYTPPSMRLSFLDLDSANFPSCDNGTMTYQSTSVPSPCTVCGSGQSWSGTVTNVNASNCMYFIDGSTRSTADFAPGAECVHLPMAAGTTRPIGVRYATARPTATQSDGLTAGRSVHVVMESATSMRTCGVEMGTGADNALNPMALGQATFSTSYYRSGLVSGQHTYGVDQRARALTLTALTANVTRTATCQCARPCSVRM